MSQPNGADYLFTCSNSYYYSLSATGTDTFVSGNLNNATLSFNDLTKSVYQDEVISTVPGSYYVTAIEYASFTQAENQTATLSTAVNGSPTESFSYTSTGYYTATTSVVGYLTGYGGFNASLNDGEVNWFTETGNVINGSVTNTVTYTSVETFTPYSSGGVPYGVNYEEIIETDAGFSDAFEANSFTTPTQTARGAIHPGTGMPVGSSTDLYQLAGEQVSRNLDVTMGIDEIHAGLSAIQLSDGGSPGGRWQARPAAIGYIRPGFGHGIGSSGSGSGGGGNGSSPTPTPSGYFTPRMDFGTQNGFATEEAARVVFQQGFIPQDPVIAQALPMSRATEQVAVPIIAHVAPPGGYLDPLGTNIAALQPGSWSGPSMVADTLTIGTTAPAVEPVAPLVGADLGTSLVDLTGVNVSRTLMLIAGTLGIEAEGTYAVNSVRAASVLYGALPAQWAFVARSVDQTFVENNLATLNAWSLGAEWGLAATAGFTAPDGAVAFGGYDSLGVSYFVTGTPLVQVGSTQPNQELIAGGSVLTSEDGAA